MEKLLASKPISTSVKQGAVVRTALNGVITVCFCIKCCWTRRSGVRTTSLSWRVILQPQPISASLMPLLWTLRGWGIMVAAWPMHVLLVWFTIQGHTKRSTPMMLRYTIVAGVLRLSYLRPESSTSSNKKGCRSSGHQFLTSAPWKSKSLSNKQAWSTLLSLMSGQIG